MFVQAVQDPEQFQHGYGGPHARLDLDPHRAPSISPLTIAAAHAAMKAAGRAAVPGRPAHAPARPLARVGRVRAEAELTEAELDEKFPEQMKALRERYAKEAAKETEAEKTDDTPDEDLDAEEFAKKYPEAAKRIYEQALARESARLAKEQAAKDAEEASPAAKNAKAAARFEAAWSAKAAANIAAQVNSPRAAALVSVARADPDGHDAWIAQQQGRGPTAKASAAGGNTGTDLSTRFAKLVHSFRIDEHSKGNTQPTGAALARAKVQDPDGFEAWRRQPVEIGG